MTSRSIAARVFLGVSALLLLSTGHPARVLERAVHSEASPAHPTAEAAEEDEDEGKLEIEVTGRLEAQASAARFVIYAQAEPCDLERLGETKPAGIDSLVDTGDVGPEGKVFAFEAVLDEDEKPYVCAIAFDAERRVVGFGGQASSPITVLRDPGEEYGRAHGLAIPVRPIDPPRAIDDPALLHHSG